MSHRNGEMLLFTGNANPKLVHMIAKSLEMPCGRAEVGKFSNGETKVLINETVRAQDVFVIQPTCHPSPNDYLMELLIMIDAVRRGSAGRITAVIPFFGYSKQERMTRARTPITAKLVSNLIMAAGANRVLTMDLHAQQVQGFFDIPVDHLQTEQFFALYIKQYVKTEKVVIAPKPGGVKRAKQLADAVNSDLAFLQRNRRTNEVSLIGSVEGKTAIIVDDIADTCQSLTIAAHMCREAGATGVIIMCSHCILSEPGIESLLTITNLHYLVVTNTCPWEHAAKAIKQLVVLDVSHMFAEAVRRIHNGESISLLCEGVGELRSWSKIVILCAPADHKPLLPDPSVQAVALADPRLTIGARKTRSISIDLSNCERPGTPSRLIDVITETLVVTPPSALDTSLILTSESMLRKAHAAAYLDTKATTQQHQQAHDRNAASAIQHHHHSSSGDSTPPALSIPSKSRSNSSTSSTAAAASRGIIAASTSAPAAAAAAAQQPEDLTVVAEQS